MLKCAQICAAKTTHIWTSVSTYKRRIWTKSQFRSAQPACDPGAVSVILARRVAVTLIVCNECAGLEVSQMGFGQTREACALLVLARAEGKATGGTHLDRLLMGARFATGLSAPGWVRISAWLRAAFRAACGERGDADVAGGGTVRRRVTLREGGRKGRRRGEQDERREGRWWWYENKRHFELRPAFPRLMTSLTRFKSSLQLRQVESASDALKLEIGGVPNRKLKIAQITAYRPHLSTFEHSCPDGVLTGGKEQYLLFVLPTGAPTRSRKTGRNASRSFADAGMLTAPALNLTGCNTALPRATTGKIMGRTASHRYSHFWLNCVSRIRGPQRNEAGGEFINETDDERRRLRGAMYFGWALKNSP
ncbi:hypothetical protein DFH09DRAFT_1094293 [Mycena vulgaris]|nr:hypothetical protein DFH09DRAFT_1094293 [Mycena vulgaris]